MKINRRKCKIIKIGQVLIGGRQPIAIQSMVKVKAADIEKAVAQIRELESEGCEIVRLAISDIADARAIRNIKPHVNIPLAADIHFDWRLALEAIESGVDKIRLNPGNIYKVNEIKEIVKAAKLHRIPIRVGLNSGSLPKHEPRNRAKRSEASPKGTNHKNIAGLMVKGALDYIKILEKYKFNNIVVSLKASNVLDTIAAYRKISKLMDYPLHLGVTASGTYDSGVIKSSIGIGALLLEGLGDTIRVSLTDEPKLEVKAAKAILEAAERRNFGPEIISCPTCGRCEVDVVSLAKKLETRLSSFVFRPSSLPPKIALMGCVVNGPGEAKDADIGIAFGKKDGLLFKKGKPIKKISADKCVDTLLEELDKTSY